MTAGLFRVFWPASTLLRDRWSWFFLWFPIPPVPFPSLWGLLLSYFWWVFRTNISWLSFNVVWVVASLLRSLRFVPDPLDSQVNTFDTNTDSIQHQGLSTPAQTIQPQGLLAPIQNLFSSKDFWHCRDNIPHTWTVFSSRDYWHQHRLNLTARTFDNKKNWIQEQRLLTMQELYTPYMDCIQQQGLCTHKFFVYNLSNKILAFRT